VQLVDEKWKRVTAMTGSYEGYRVSLADGRVALVPLWQVQQDAELQAKVNMFIHTCEDCQASPGKLYGAYARRLCPSCATKREVTS